MSVLLNLHSFGVHLILHQGMDDMCPFNSMLMKDFQKFAEWMLFVNNSIWKV